jgi:hypothetical protein
VTKVGYSRAVWGLIWVGFPLAGAAAGWLLNALLNWAVPLSGGLVTRLLNLLGSIGEPQDFIGAAVIGAAAGFVVALLAAKDAIELDVADDAVGVQRGSRPQRQIQRADVVGVFTDAKYLVLLGPGGAEQLREKHDLDEAQLRHAFEGHGWPWLTEGDPHAGQYRRFVDDDPDLPPAANALLKARAVAVSKDDGHDLAELRDELGKLGVVVRDERKRQYWRLIQG